MKVTYGTYELEFDNNLADLFEKHVYDTIEASAPAYIFARTNCEDVLVNCRKHSKDEIYNFVMESITEDLRLCGVNVNG